MANQPLLDELKDRELEILRLIAEGLSNREIADSLFVSVNTVRWYNKQIYSKLGVHSRTHAIARAREMGLLDDGAESVMERSPQGDAILPPLPPQPTSFVGRLDELDQITHLLTETDCRLLTIVGAGGMGKTRLSIEAASLLVDDFEHGVLFVSLAPISAAEDVAATILSAIGLKASESEAPLAQLITFLRDKQILLVLDNFEHVLDGAQVISDLLGAAPEVCCLATSRERLNLREETVFDLRGMTVPQGGEAEDIVLYSAVQLFLQSTRQVRPEYQPDEKALAAIANICVMVAGMPLGIELAAAWMDMLPPDEIAREIERSLDFLTTEVRNIPERHRSMRAVFDSAWHRLSDKERETFARLSVFRGGFTREAAEAVASTGLAGLVSLLSKSLVRADPDEGRYAIHELLRQFAEEQLENSGSSDAAREGHGRYYLDRLVRQAKSEDSPDWGELAPDFENIRRSWRWAAQKNEQDLLYAAHHPMYHFCTWLGRYEEARRLYDYAIRKLEVDPDKPVPELVLHLYDLRGTLNSLMGDFDRAVDDLCYVQDMLEGTTDHPRWEQNVAVRLSQVYRKSDHQDKAESKLLDVLEKVRAQGNQEAESDVLYHLGTVAWDQGRNDEALAYHQEAEKLARQQNPPGLTLVQALHGLGEALQFAGRPQESNASLTESLELARQIGDKSYVAENLLMIGWTYAGIFGTADYERAVQMVEESLTITSNTSLGWHHLANSVGFGCFSYPVDYGRGLRALREQLEPGGRAGFRRMLSIAADQLGDLYRDLGLYDEALEAHQLAYSYCDKANIQFWLPRIEANILIDRMRLGALDVEADLRQVRDQTLARNLAGHGVRALEGLAELYVKVGDPAAAVDTADQLLEIAERGDMSEMVAQAHRWRGEALILQGMLDQAEDALRQALELTETNGRLKLRHDVHQALAKLAAERGDSAAEREHHMAALGIWSMMIDSLKDEAIVEQLAQGQ